MPYDHRFEFFYHNPQIIKVQGKPLDAVLDGEFDLVLMDIEGAEYREMLGMQNILGATKHFVCELVPNHMKHADACILQQFASRIAQRFTKFSLTTSPSEVVGRDGLDGLYQKVRREYNSGGSDLICSVE